MLVAALKRLQSVSKSQSQEVLCSGYVALKMSQALFLERDGLHGSLWERVPPFCLPSAESAEEAMAQHLDAAAARALRQGT